MNKSVLGIMGGALLMALLVAVVVNKKLNSDPQVVAPETVEILVAAKKLLVGEKIKQEQVRWEVWPEKAIYKGLFVKEENTTLADLDIYASPLRRGLESGEPVTTQALVPSSKDGNNYLAALISPGMRAVAVNVKANTMVGGFLAPGDHVDVILAYSPRIPDGARDLASQIVQSTASQVVLSNVKVLAVDQSAKDADREAKVAKTVTLEVDREGAETLALVNKMGDITLALRRIGEKDDPAEDTRKLLTTDTRTSDVIRIINEVKQQSQTDTNSVRIYSGNSVQSVPVRETPVQGE